MKSQTEFDSEEKIRPSDLRAQAHVLVEMGLMPPLEKILAAVAEARKKFKPQIEAARRTKKQGEANR
jgi:hypothetical protein